MSQRRFPAPAPRPGAAEPDAASAPARSDRNDRNERPERGREQSRPPQASRSPHAPHSKGRANWKAKPAPKSGYGPQSAPSHPGTEENNAAEEDKALQVGIKPVLELLQRDPSKVDAVFVLKGRRGKDTDAILDICRGSSVRFSLVDAAFLDRLWPGRHQGVVARLLSTGFTDLEDVLEQALDAPLPLILALDQVQDPGNAGTLARTVYALGGGGLLIPRHNGVYLGGAAAKASAGALEQLPVSKVANLGQALDAAKKAGFTLYGAASLPKAPAEKDPDGPVYENIFTFTPQLPAVLVLGSEEGGLRPTIARRCDALLHIPLARDFDSLNVAQAGAVILARFAATRGQ